jgi:hypothetical protein
VSAVLIGVKLDPLPFCPRDRTARRTRAERRVDMAMGSKNVIKCAPAVGDDTGLDLMKLSQQWN